MERNEYQEDKYRKFIYSSKRRIQRMGSTIRETYGRGHS